MTTATEPTTTTYALEPAHSSVEFAVKHMLIATTKGRFQDFEVTAEIDETNFANSSAVVTLKAESIDTRQPDRDAHLRSADFLDAENHPALTFVTRRIEPNKGDWRITGDRTIRGVTREVVLDGEVSGPVTDPWGGRRIGLSAKGKVNRKDFGMVWNAALDNGGFVLADDVKLSIEVELLKAS
jgi:polyisoprenoid-binding protein YceI